MKYLILLSLFLVNCSQSDRTFVLKHYYVGMCGTFTSSSVSMDQAKKHTVQIISLDEYTATVKEFSNRKIYDIGYDKFVYNQQTWHQFIPLDCPKEECK